jgi:hypothetical protein
MVIAATIANQLEISERRLYRHIPECSLNGEPSVKLQNAKKMEAGSDFF